MQQLISFIECDLPDYSHALWWSPCSVRDCWGFSFFFLSGAMSCRISPLPGSRFNTFLAALVSMILICFHRQGSNTQTRHNLVLEFQSLFATRDLQLHHGGESRGGGIHFCVPHVLTGKTAGPLFVKPNLCEIY